jgi:hypothetical protein
MRTHTLTPAALAAAKAKAKESDKKPAAKTIAAKPKKEDSK